MLEQNESRTGRFESPGGFEFGVQGWSWGEQRPTSITFFLNGIAQVSDQYGRPIRGTVSPEGKPVYFHLCTHAQVLEALAEHMNADLIAEINKAGEPCRQCKGTKRAGEKWCPACYHKASGESTGLQPAMQCAGWPQLPYDQLKKLKVLPPTPVEELRKIRDPQLRKDALRIRREIDEARAKESQPDAEE